MQAENKGSDQPAQMRRLIWAFVIRIPKTPYNAQADLPAYAKRTGPFREAIPMSFLIFIGLNEIFFALHFAPLEHIAQNIWELAYLWRH